MKLNIKGIYNIKQYTYGRVLLNSAFESCLFSLFAASSPFLRRCSSTFFFLVCPVFIYKYGSVYTASILCPSKLMIGNSDESLLYFLDTDGLNTVIQPSLHWNYNM
jgi:hypothetical protein